MTVPRLVRYNTLVNARCLLRLIAFCALLLLGPGLGHAQTTPRGAEHDGFGRVVFDWDGPVKWSADVLDNQLVVRFEKPIAGDPKVLLKAVGKYLKTTTLSPDRRMVTFALTQPVQLKTFVSGTSTVIDLKAARDPVQPAEPAKPTTAEPAKPTTAEPARPAAAKPEPARPEAATDIMVRGGEHTGFNRLVFDWPKPVGYSVNVEAGTAVIAFDRPAAVNVTALEAALPPDVRVISQKPQGKGTALVLGLPADMRVRHFTSGPKVALDLVRAAGSPPPPRAIGAAPPPLAPAPGADEQPPAVNAAKPAEPPKTEPAKAPEPAKTAEAPRPVAEVSLGVPFDKPTAAAAFRRAGWLWLVFDSKSEVDTKLLKRTGGDVVLAVEQVPGVRNGTAIRLLTRPGFNPSIRKDGQLWVFDLAEAPLAPKVPLAVERQFDFEERGRLLLPVAEAPAQPVSFRDPEIGDTLQVMPLTAVGTGLAGEVAVPGAELLPTVQGVALVALADGARLEGNRSGVEVSMPGGLHLSRDLPSAGAEAGPVPIAAVQASAGGPLDVARWMRGGPDKFVAEHQKLLRGMAYVKPEDKNVQRLEIARHYLANAMPAEALGVLKLIGTIDPAAIETPQFRAVRGAASFLMRRDVEAIDDLAHPSLARDPQAQLWLAAAKARATGELAKHALMLRLASDDIKGLHPRIRMAIGPIAVRAAAAAGDTKAATRIIETMGGPGLSRRDVGTISHMQGVVAEAAKQWDQAVAKYREAEDGESRPDRAHAARARIELQLRRGLIPAAEAIRQLEKLRFAWREGDFEYTLLKRLGDLMVADGQYGDGLRMLRAIVANYAEHPDVGNVQQMMAETFEKLYLGGLADKLSPIAAIGLYDEFQELTPTGAKGDEMIRKLADRLAAVDLLDRASDLLRHQVQFRLQGGDKARVGARLAFLQMSDRKPGLALESLDMSEVPDQPADLYDQRRYLRVRALADLGRSAEALALIINDQSDQARQLRAEIYWDLKKWPEAAAAMEALIEKPEGATPVTPALARRLVDLATAMTLGRDERGLQRLRRAYGGKMAATEFRDAFDLLTSEAERGIIDYRRVADKIKQVENFQTFMTDWRKRVQTQGLSSVN